MSSIMNFLYEVKCKICNYTLNLILTISRSALTPKKLSLLSKLSLVLAGPLKPADSFSLAISYNFRAAFGTLTCWKIIFL